MKQLAVVVITYIVFHSNIVIGGECEKATGRQSIQCLEEKYKVIRDKIAKQDERLRALEKISTNSSSTSTVAQKVVIPSYNKNKKTKKGNYTFELEGCRNEQAKNYIECTFFVTNEIEEHIVVFGDNWTRLFLMSGGSAEASEIYLGNTGGKSDYDYSFAFPSKVPIQGKAIFNKMGGGAEAASLFQFRMAPKNNKDSIVTIDFRDVAIALNN